MQGFTLIAPVLKENLKNQLRNREASHSSQQKEYEM